MKRRKKLSRATAYISPSSSDSLIALLSLENTVEAIFAPNIDTLPNDTTRFIKLILITENNSLVDINKAIKLVYETLNPAMWVVIQNKHMLSL